VVRGGEDIMYAILMLVTNVESAIRAWLQLDAAFAAVNADLVRRHGVTGAQVGMLRLIEEFGGALTLAELRERLALHPASLGQLLARLASKGLVTIGVDAADRRRRTVTLTTAGRGLIADAPLVGPVRLRTHRPDEATLHAITEGFGAALDAFGLTDYVPERNSK
jgi:MarR family transcriptional regulator, temperature-dependent positive regulator of motility